MLLSECISRSCSVKTGKSLYSFEIRSCVGCTKMATDDIGFKVEKLTAHSYHHWKFQTKMCLIGKDLWEIVTGTEALPTDASAEV